MEHFSAIAAALGEQGLDAMLITSEAGERYAAGFMGEGAVLVTACGEHYYFTDSRYTEAAEQTVTGAAVCTPAGRSYPAAVAGIAGRLGLARVGFEEESMTVAVHARWSQALETVTLVPAQNLLTRLRAVKDADEFAAMTAAQRISEHALDEILNFLRPGVTEQEVAARLQYEMLRRGAQKMSFDPIVASGPHSSMPHAVPTGRALAAGDFVTMDFGCVVDGYCSDMTRTVAVGHVTDEMERVYDTVLRAQLAGIAAVKADVPGSAVDAAARQVIEQAGYGEFFGHSFGHSLGLEIHENPNFSPRWEDPIPAGAVLSAEPGIYLPGRFGVRIEDVVLVTADGCENLTKAPKTLIIV